MRGTKAVAEAEARTLALPVQEAVEEAGCACCGRFADAKLFRYALAWNAFTARTARLRGANSRCCSDARNSMVVRRSS